MNYVVTTTLPKEFAGRTKSLLKRTRLLNEEAGLPFTIITTNYQPNYNDIYQHYYKSGYIAKDVNLINIYDFLAKRTYKVTGTADHDKNEPGLMRYELSKNKIYRYFENGKYVLYKSYENPGNRLKFIDVMDPFHRKRNYRKEYNYKGLCHKELIYKQGTTNVLEEIFYDEHGRAYLNKTYNGAADNKLIRIYHFLDNNEAVEFQNEKEFIKYCFEQMIEKNSPVICDARYLDRPLIEMSVPGTRKIFLLHNSHLNGSDLHDIKSSYRYIIENYGQLDFLVVLTEHQKKDLAHVLPDVEKVKVVPHSVKLIKESPPLQKRGKTLVSIGRLAKEKQVDHLIEAYRLSQAKLADFRLDIYGSGDEQEKLEQLIKQYGLQDNVFLMGTTNEPDRIFSAARASFLASQYEGFGLVVQESINNGCPVAAYDIKYGPQDLITNGQNGLLVEPDNIEALSAAMSEIVKMDFKKVSLPERFSDEMFLDNWLQILSQQKNRNPLRKFFSKI